jgi:hypothetical protein
MQAIAPTPDAKLAFVEASEVATRIKIFNVETNRVEHCFAIDVRPPDVCNIEFVSLQRFISNFAGDNFILYNVPMRKAEPNFHLSFAFNSRITALPVNLADSKGMSHIVVHNCLNKPSLDLWSVQPKKFVKKLLNVHSERNEDLSMAALDDTSLIVRDENGTRHCDMQTGNVQTISVETIGKVAMLSAWAFVALGNGQLDVWQKGHAPITAEEYRKYKASLVPIGLGC